MVNDVVSVQHKDGFLLDIMPVTLYDFYHKGTRLNPNTSFCPSSQCEFQPGYILTVPGDEKSHGTFDAVLRR